MNKYPIKRLYLSQKGAALTMVILLIAIMSTLGVSILWLTYSEYSMNIFMSDVDRAYYAAEAAMDRAAANLDKRVAKAQEDARLSAEAQIKALLALQQQQNTYLVNEDGSINNEVINELFREKYLEAFNAIITDNAGFFVNIGSNEALAYLLGVEGGAIGSEGELYIPVDETKRATLLSAVFNPVLKTVTVISSGSYLRKGGDTNLSQRITATYSLLPDPEEMPYRIIPKMSVIHPAIPAVLEKAVTAEGNLVAAGGTVSITGDVLCFGTVPSSDGTEDQAAPWYRYGGIIAGIPDITSVIPDAGAGGTGITGIGDFLGFDDAVTGTRISGSVNITGDPAKGINGDAATMGYIHILYGSYDSPSSISINGSTYARAIKAGASAPYSRIILSDAYTTDNLQVDSDMSLIDISGTYCGFVTASYDINGSGNLQTDPQDEYRYKNTSSIIVNGNSKISLNGTADGGVFIGGSSFFSNYNDTAYYPAESRPYMTGFSALKSGSRLPYAFKELNALNGETRLYTGNGQYLLNTGFTMKPYSNTTDLLNITTENMLFGIDGIFTLSERAAHTKWLWEEVWKQDYLYSRYIDTSSISISTESDGKIFGYAFGNIAANGKIYGQGDFNPLVDASNFGLYQKGAPGITGWIKEFHDQIGPLLAENYDSQKPKLDYVECTKNIDSYMDARLAQGYGTPTAVSVNGRTRGIVYVKYGDCRISGEAGVWTADGYVLQMMKGIIIVFGNIYIEDGFEFTGTLLSSGNVIFMGNAGITYDGGLISDMLLNPGISGLFRQVRFTLDDEPVLSQRISKINIKLMDWARIN